MTAEQARAFWRALVDNAAHLVDDSALLAATSPARSRSLPVLAQEELGKAVRVYNAFESSWSSGRDEERAVPELSKGARDHLAKFMEAYKYGDDLDHFWGDFSSIGDLPDSDDAEDWRAWAQARQTQAREASREANAAKQAGFYVDLKDGGACKSPTDVDIPHLAGRRAFVAGVIEMLLIQDHVRMKHQGMTYDSTHATQARLLRHAHPEYFEEAGADGGLA